MAQFRVLAISGSLRAASYNTALLKAAIELAPSNLDITTYNELGEIPPYNDDVQSKGYPPIVQRFREQIASVDGLLIVSPEYNYSIPGVLKNAIDWASRPPKQPFDGKPLALMGASQGGGGTMRGQYHLRQVAVFLNMHVLNKPEVFLARAQEKIDAQGRLTDEGTRKVVGDCMTAFAAWIAKMKAQ